MFTVSIITRDGKIAFQHVINNVIAVKIMSSTSDEMIFFGASKGRAWQSGEVPEDWKKTNVIPDFKNIKSEDEENYWSVGLIFIPGKVMKQLILETNSKHMEDKKVIRSSQHRLIKGKSCLTNLIAFSEGTNGWIDEEKAVNIAYLSFREVFPTVSHIILISKLRKFTPDEWIMRWIGNGLKSRSLTVLISDTGLVVNLSIALSPKIQYWAKYSLNDLSMTWMKGQMPRQQIH
ncbi:RNA-directed DNA polymerase from mobile element jockey-like protein [Willisornis vidua]|uniref:RNA-directed DNA polymerase from mobile element jockey-like protein n=1 Tax=Willisornis vidua TaxID=1566151 RepID=A0ABQ9D8E0_9PASS|nr:RNA-directed DNA polymerase from mobile element jockey-like protein [Willisornis vidua]